MTPFQLRTDMRPILECGALRSSHTLMRIGAPIRRAHAPIALYSMNSAFGAKWRDLAQATWNMNYV